MFKFLKDKLKSSVFNISKKIDEEGKEEVIEEVKEDSKEGIDEKPVEQKEVKEELTEEKKKEVKEKPIEQEEAKEAEKEPEKKGFFSRLKEKFTEKKEETEEGFEEVDLKSEVDKAENPEETKEEVKEKKETPSIQELAERKEQKEKIVEERLPEEEKKGIFGKIKEKIVTKKIDEKKFEDLFWSLETTLLENNVAVEVIDKIKGDLKQELVDKPIKRSQIEKTIEQILKKSIKELFDIEQVEFIEKVKQKNPFVICFVGINGSGKTTTIAKISKLLQDNGLKCVMAAADTFRAASIEQLQLHADKLGIKLIKHDYGSDPAAVAFDAVKHANSKKIDVVLIDTAGRMHSNVNLMDELKKVVKVAEPDLTIFVGEAITGNDCVEQIKKFNEGVNVDGIILTKMDIDEKGGAAISVSYVTKKPILFVGTGQEYSDLARFKSDVVINSLGLEA
jgi:fused signal recognition particle receptor